jgi:hypothetical protein
VEASAPEGQDVVIVAGQGFVVRSAAGDRDGRCALVCRGRSKSGGRSQCNVPRTETTALDGNRRGAMGDGEGNFPKDLGRSPETVHEVSIDRRIPPTDVE